MMRTPAGAGYTLALVAALCAALNASLTRALLDTGMTPSAVIPLRFGVVVVLLGGVFLIRRRRPMVPRRRETPATLAMGASLVAMTGGYVVAIEHLSIGVMLAVFYLYPLVVIAFRTVFWGQRDGPRVTIAAGGALVGSALVVRIWDTGGLDVVGVLGALVACLGSAAYLLLNEAAGKRRVDLPSSLLWWFLLAAALWCAIDIRSFPEALSGVDSGQVMLILGIGIVGTLVPFACVAAAAATTASDRIAVVLMTETGFAAGFAFLLHGERLTPVQMAGIALLMVSVATAQLVGRRTDGPEVPDGAVA